MNSRNTFLPSLGLLAVWENTPTAGLLRGDVGTMVLLHPDGEHFEVKFADMKGETFVVTTLHQSQLLALEYNNQLMVPVHSR